MAASADLENAWAETRTGRLQRALAQDLDQRLRAHQARVRRASRTVTSSAPSGVEGSEVDRRVLDTEGVLEPLAAWGCAASGAAGHPRTRRAPCCGPAGPWCHGRPSCGPCRRCRGRPGAWPWSSPWAGPDRAASLRHLLHADQVRHPGDHAPDLGSVRQVVGLPDAAQAERPQRAAVLGLGPDGRARSGSPAGGPRRSVLGRGRHGQCASAAYSSVSRLRSR